MPVTICITGRLRLQVSFILNGAFSWPFLATNRTSNLHYAAARRTISEKFLNQKNLHHLWLRYHDQKRISRLCGDDPDGHNYLTMSPPENDNQFPLVSS